MKLNNKVLKNVASPHFPPAAAATAAPPVGVINATALQENRPVVRSDQGPHPRRQHRRSLRPGAVDRPHVHGVGGRGRHPRPALVQREVRRSWNLRHSQGTIINAFREAYVYIYICIYI